jgi:hypothetical protein
MCFDPTRPLKKLQIIDGSKEKCIYSNWSFVGKNVDPRLKSRWVKATKQIVVELNFLWGHSGGIQVLFAHEHLHL